MTSLKTAIVTAVTAAILIAGSAVSVTWAGDEPDSPWQPAFVQFPLLTPANSNPGQPVYQTLKLGDPVTVGDTKYYGFKFKIPPRKNKEDLVLSFVEPGTLLNWHIESQTDGMVALSNYFFVPKDDYPQADDLLPLDGRRLITLNLGGDTLEDGQTYLFCFTVRGNTAPAQLSAAVTFAHLTATDLDAMEKEVAKTLGLDSDHYLEHPLGPPVINPDNHHTYILLRAATWKDAEARAVALGGHLATVRNQAEEDWLFKTFGTYGGEQRLLWTGLSDRDKKFHFSWSSGESASYTDWAKGEPNNALSGEDYVAIYYPNHSQANKWNDWGDRDTDPIYLPMNGVVEIIPPAPATPANVAPVAVKPAVVPILPNIVISSESGSIRLQWPISAAGCALEATTNLSQPFTMFGYSELTNIDTGVIYVTITNPVPTMFFRLSKP
jgi:hypothetical protein